MRSFYFYHFRMLRKTVLTFLRCSLALLSSLGIRDYTITYFPDFFVPTRWMSFASMRGLIKSKAPCLEIPNAFHISRGVMLLSRKRANSCSCLGRNTSFTPAAYAEKLCTRTHTRSRVFCKPSAVYSSQPVRSSPFRRTASSA